MAENKYALVTRAKSNYREISSLTHPILKNYASRCDADFIVIDKEVYNLGSFHYEIMQCHDLFDRYERLLIIDSDVIITPSCPNLFDIVPEDCVGTIFEDKYSRKSDRINRIRKVQEQWGDIGWKRGYMNMGVYVCSRCHRKLFDVREHRIWNDSGYADVSVRYFTIKYGYKTFELPYKFNHMSMFSELGRNRLKSYMIHYAGRGFSGKKSRAEQIASDLKILQNVSNPFFLNFYNIKERIRLLAICILSHIRNFKK